MLCRNQLLIMIDKKVKEKKRSKIQKLIQDRVRDSDGQMTEVEVRNAVMKEQTAPSNQKKRHSEQDKVREAFVLKKRKTVTFGH